MVLGPKAGPLPQTTQHQGRHPTHQLHFGKENPPMIWARDQAEPHPHPKETFPPQPMSLQPHAGGTAPPAPRNPQTYSDTWTKMSSVPFSGVMNP